MIKMPNLILCVFCHNLKKNGNGSTNKKEEYCLGHEFSILDSVVFRKHRCLNSDIADYDSGHLDYGLGFFHLRPGM